MFKFFISLLFITNVWGNWKNRCALNNDLLSPILNHYYPEIKKNNKNFVRLKDIKTITSDISKEEAYELFLEFQEHAEFIALNRLKEIEKNLKFVNDNYEDFFLKYLNKKERKITRSKKKICIQDALRELDFDIASEDSTKQLESLALASLMCEQKTSRELLIINLRENAKNFEALLERNAKTLQIKQTKVSRKRYLRLMRKEFRKYEDMFTHTRNHVSFDKIMHINPKKSYTLFDINYKLQTQQSLTQDQEQETLKWLKQIAYLCLDDQGHSRNKIILNIFDTIKVGVLITSTTATFPISGGASLLVLMGLSGKALATIGLATSISNLAISAAGKVLDFADPRAKKINAQASQEIFPILKKNKQLLKIGLKGLKSSDLADKKTDLKKAIRKLKRSDHYLHIDSEFNKMRRLKNARSDKILNTTLLALSLPAALEIGHSWFNMFNTLKDSGITLTGLDVLSELQLYQLGDLSYSLNSSSLVLGYIMNINDFLRLTPEVLHVIRKTYRDFFEIHYNPEIYIKEFQVGARTVGALILDLDYQSSGNES